LQQWDSTLFEALSKAGGSVYSNYAVGYNNVVPDANKHGIAVGNTPGDINNIESNLLCCITRIFATSTCPCNTAQDCHHLLPALRMLGSDSKILSCIPNLLDLLVSTNVLLISHRFEMAGNAAAHAMQIEGAQYCRNVLHAHFAGVHCRRADRNNSRASLIPYFCGSPPYCRG